MIRSYLNGLVVFPTFFNLSLNLAIRCSWSEPVSFWSCFCWLYRVSSSLAAKNTINLISVLTIWWCLCLESSHVVGRGCLLWPVRSLQLSSSELLILRYLLKRNETYIHTKYVNVYSNSILPTNRKNPNVFQLINANKCLSTNKNKMG